VYGFVIGLTAYQLKMYMNEIRTFLFNHNFNTTEDMYNFRINQSVSLNKSEFTYMHTYIYMYIHMYRYICTSLGSKSVLQRQ